MPAVTRLTRVVARLRELFADDPAAQTATPLEIVRSAYREPTAVLEVAAIPPVERDAFDERAWPDDRYGLVPRTLGDLGDPDLAPLMLAWGMAKAAVLRGRATAGRRVTRSTAAPGIERHRFAPEYAAPPDKSEGHLTSPTHG